MENPLRNYDGPQPVGVDIPNYYKLCERIWDEWSQYGSINGVGYTKLDSNGQVSATGGPAISVTFESLKPGVELSGTPTRFEGVLVKSEVIGTIFAL